MTVARHYRMEAAEDKADALLHALKALAQAVKAIPGCEGVDLLQDIDAPHCFVFIEQWISVEAHKAAGEVMAKDVLGPVMAALRGRPDAAYLNYLDA